MELRGLRTAQFRVDDLTAARDWYSGLLGKEPYFDEPFYVGFDVGGYEFGLMPGMASRDGALFLWAAEDPAAFIAHAVSHGGGPGMEPTDTGDGTVVGTFVDPFGNEFGVIRNPHFAAPLTYASPDDMADREISITVEVPVPASRAFDLWATERGLAEWLTDHTKVDLRPGGFYEIHWDPDAAPGDKGADWCRVLSFLPGRMLSFTWNAPPHLKTRPLHTWVVLLFEPTDAGCRVELNHFGWPASELADLESDWPATYAYFEEAWRSVMEQFTGFFDDQ